VEVTSLSATATHTLITKLPPLLLITTDVTSRLPINYIGCLHYITIHF